MSGISTPPDGPGTRGSFTPVGVAAVGLGYWGPNVARAWAATPEARLRWICDQDEGRLARAGALLPDAHRTTALDDVLADPSVDVVSVATGARSHGALAARALLAGKHVCVEKPLATSVAEAQWLASLAAETDRLLQVGHLLVHHPAVAELKALLDADALGETRYVYTTRVNLGQVRADENALWSLGAHDVSVLLHLLGETPASVSAQGACFIRPGVEDVVFCLLRFPSGVLAHLQLSWLDPHKMRRITIVGAEKMAVFDDMRLEQKVTVYDKGVTAPGPGGVASYGEYVQLRSGDAYAPAISAEEPLRIECRSFARAIRGLEPPRSGAQDGVAVVAVLEALQHSLNVGGEVVPLADLPVPVRG